MLTSQRSYTLRVDLEKFNGESRHADYRTFIVLNEQDKYKLTVGGYSGNARKFTDVIYCVHITLIWSM